MSERMEAKASGERFYLSATPCANGHTAKRYTSSGICLECSDIFRRNHRAKLEKKPRPKISRSGENKRRAAEAKLAEQKTFVPEFPCWNGHIERFVSSNNCVECHKQSILKRKDKGKYHRIRREYGLTETQHEDMYIKQKGCCKICNTHEPTKFRLHIDHCHDTGKVRGLLCNRCNQGIGLLKNSVDIMQKAIKYLEKSEKE